MLFRSESFRLLRARNDEIVVFHILDHAEVELPFTKVTHLQDSETGHIYPANIQELKKTHAKRVEQFRSRFQTECRRNRITYVPIDTSFTYVQAISKMLKLRKQLL